MYKYIIGYIKNQIWKLNIGFLKKKKHLNRKIVKIDILIKRKKYWIIIGIYYNDIIKK